MRNRGFATLGRTFAAAVVVAVAAAALPAAASFAAPASSAAARSLIPVGKQGTSGPSTVTAVGSMAYVTVAPLRNFALPGYLAYVDLGRKRVVAQVKVGGNPEGFAFDAATGLGYVSNYDSRKQGTIRVVDIKQRKVVGTLSAGLNPWTLAVVGSRRGRLLVVLNNGNGTHGSIDIWNLTTVRRIRRLGLKFSPVGLAPIGGDRMLVGSFDTKAAWVLDLNALKLVRRVPVPAGPINGLAAGAKRVYLTGFDGITVLDRRTLKPAGPLIDPLAPGNPLGVAVSSGDTAYVVDNGAPGATKPTGGLAPGSPPFPSGTLQILRGTRTLGSRKLGRDAQEVALADRGRKLLVTARLDAKLWMLPKP